MPSFRTLDDINVSDRTVLVRCDLNVPMSDGRVTDTTRIDRVAPTLRALSDQGARVVVLSHFGRPKGQRATEMSLRPVAPVLAKAVGREVAFAEDCIGPAAADAIGALGPGGVVLLENLRFHAGEEANDPAFAAELAALGDVYVNDAFSAAHRAHASTAALAGLLPAVAGRALADELIHLAAALENPQRPVAALVGGAKVSTKLAVLGNLVGQVDLLIIGGGMANTFLAAHGVEIGRSLCELDLIDQAREITAKAKAAGCDIVLPTDSVVAKELVAGTAAATISVKSVPEDAMILDIGPMTADHLARRLSECRTLLWNGPLGAFEVAPFDAGTNSVARAAAAQTKAGNLITVAGGGDTVAALAHAGVLEDFTYVSTAGGAFLEWLEGRTLPGVAALAA
ncbi:MAG: phosphoglycerate kinase [Alphaproteobacteria bacterium]|nr:phosphoglycerate kinase [Alphaproteobacteria bacterium]